jgi:hypothetical protein
MGKELFRVMVMVASDEEWYYFALNSLLTI